MSATWLILIILNIQSYFKGYTWEELMISVHSANLQWLNVRKHATKLKNQIDKIDKNQDQVFIDTCTDILQIDYP